MVRIFSFLFLLWASQISAADEGRFRDNSIPTIRWGGPERLLIGGTYQHDIPIPPNFVISASVGQAGARLSAGLGGFGGLGSGVTAQATVLQTYGNPSELAPDRTYVGYELGVMFFALVSVKAGYVHRASDGDPFSNDSMRYVSFGLGL